MKEKIECKALELFLKKGYKNVSLVEIAKELDITKGGIYHYFSSKDDLLFSVFDLVIDQLVSIVKLPNIEEKGLLFLINRFMESAFLSEEKVDAQNRANNFEFLIYSIREYPQLKTRLSETYQEVQSVIITVVKKDIEKGILQKDINPSTIAFEFSALFEGVLVIKELYLAEDCSFMAKEIFERFYDSIKAI